MDYDAFGSLAKHPDFIAAVKARRVKRAAKLPPCLALPFAGKPAKVFARQVACFADRLANIGCRHAVVGLSGGLDSALALLVTVAAFERLGHDRAGIHAFTLPGFGTTARTKGNAELLAEGLGLALKTVPIASSCRWHLKEIGHDAKTPDLTYENAQARMRTLILMDTANLVGGIVVGTGDMSEIALGWSTYNGDHMSMFAVNAGVPKTIVREVCLWWADDADRRGGKGAHQAAQALRDIAATPISPELKKNQKTEETVGPYELHDFFLAEYIGRNRSKAEVLARAAKAFAGVYDAATIAKWLDFFVRRLLTQAFKRNCAPDGIKIYRDVYFGPHDWHVPSDVAARVRL